MANGGKRHLVEMPRRHFQSPGGQAEFRRGRADRLETRAVAGGMAKRANPREADIAPEVPADHRQARGAAVHLVNLANERDAPAAPRLFPEQLSLGERL